MSEHFSTAIKCENLYHQEIIGRVDFADHVVTFGAVYRTIPRTRPSPCADPLISTERPRPPNSESVSNSRQRWWRNLVRDGPTGAIGGSADTVSHVARRRHT